MAAPNIVDVSTITGKTSYVALANTGVNQVVTNPANSGKVFKINNIIVSNVNGLSAADFTVSLYSEDDLGGTAYQIASTISIPADSSVVILDKNTAIYLEEDKSIGATAGTSNYLKVICSYEEIS